MGARPDFIDNARLRWDSHDTRCETWELPDYLVRHADLYALMADDYGRLVHSILKIGQAVELSERLQDAFESGASPYELDQIAFELGEILDTFTAYDSKVNLLVWGR